MARILTRSDGSFDHKLVEMISRLQSTMRKSMFLNEKSSGKKTAYSAITMKKGV